MHTSIGFVLVVIICSVGPPDVASESSHIKTTDNSTNEKPRGGIQFSTTDQALQDIVNSILSLNFSECINIPGQHGIISLDPFGNVYFKMDNIKILEKIGGEVEFVTEDDRGLRVVLRRLSLRVSANWYYRYKKFFIDVHDSGRGMFEAVNLRMHFVLLIKKGPQGSLTLRASECRGSLEDINLGIGGWLYSPITAIASYALNDPCLLLRSALTFASAIPLKFTLMDKITADFSPVQSPSFRNGSMHFLLRGEFSAINRTDTPLFHPELSQESPPDRMINLAVSKATILSLLRSFMGNGSFRAVISEADFKGSLKEHFGASCWTPTCIGFPFLQLRFGYSDHFISVEVELSRTPQVALREEGVYIRINNLSVSLNATKGRYNSHLMTFLITSTFLARLRLADKGRFHWELEKKSFAITKTISKIGYIADDAISFVIGIGLKIFLLPKLNSLGVSGMKIPLPSCLDLNNSRLKVTRKSITVETDLNIG